MTGVFPVATPIIKSVTVRHEYVAEIRAARHAEVRARLRGILESVAVDEGQTVKAGQTLFTINARVRKQDLALATASSGGAEAELQAAELELENTQLLADKNIVSPAELAKAKSNVELMRARLAQAKAAQGRASVELDQARIRAPFDGVIDRIPYKTGSAVAQDALLTTISDTRDVYAYFAITESEYLSFARTARGAPRWVSLKLADGTMFPSRGEIDAIGSEIDQATGTLTYRARFANLDGILKHGSSGKVVLETELHSAVLVPQKATFEVQGNYYVYALDADNVAHARKIGIKARLDDVFVVDTGLAAKDRFVVEGAQKLKDGMHVQVQPVGTRG